MDRDEQARSFMRRASGNELKILIALRYLEETGQKTRAEDISAEAMIDRSTVYRLLPRLTDKRWIETVYRTTEEGKQLAQFALTELSRPIPSHIITTPGPSQQCLPSNNTGPTGVANRDARGAVNPSQNATTSQNATPPTHKTPSQQLTRTNDSTGYAHPHVRRGKDLARQTAKALNDLHSLGRHTQLWYRALTLDLNNGNQTCENTIFSITSDLIDRYNRSGRHQGAAWNARVNELVVREETRKR